MRYYYKIFIWGCLLATATIEAKAQVMSVLADFSPSTSTLIGSASRIGFDNGSMSTFYMRYNDSSYFCSHHNYGYWAPWAPSVTSTKITLPQSFVITDFKKFLSDPGYIGSYQGVGMYGYSLDYNLPSGNYLRIITLPAVDQLNRTAVAHPSGNNAVVGMKFFSIGEKENDPYSIPQSYILEYYLWGNTTYLYAPLAYDPTLNEQEIADDVITLDDYVVFATRDTRKKHELVNLRISDTNNVLSSNTDIDVQWQFLLQPYENLSGELRLLPIDGGMFVLAYIIFNEKDGEYYLCVHLIKLHNLLIGINNIISHEIKINKECSGLTDMIFAPRAQTMVVLLNGEGKSAFYHFDPYVTTTTSAYKLDYDDGNFYSIDTAGSDYSSNEVLYIAMGDSTIFLQNIFNGPNINMSCLEKKKQKALLKEPPIIRILEDPLPRYSANQVYHERYLGAPLFYGTRTCNMINTTK